MSTKTRCRACIAGAWLCLGLAATTADARRRRCDEAPTGIVANDHWLRFRVPVGLMPDPRFDGRPAKLTVHRVRPVYAHGRCAWVPRVAAVLIHGRTIPGEAAFDLHAPDGTPSVQEALAWAGIDSFAPSLLGFGRSTRFDDGLGDPCNASLRPYLADGTCPYAEGCDRTSNPAVWPLDQQASFLAVNPLADERCAHSSEVRFARTDVWVRDIRQVIDDAIARARPTDGQVVLVGYSAGAQRVGRALYAANPVLPGSDEVVAKVSRAVFIAPLFGGATEETAPASGFASFPLGLNDRAGSDANFAMPPGRDAACTGHVPPGTAERLWADTLRLDRLGDGWGGDDPDRPLGLNRSPTFSGYGFNAVVAGQLAVPALVIQGLDDTVLPPSNSCALFTALPASMSNKVLVQVDCASHGLIFEGCSGARCAPGGGVPWDGPRATMASALVEWILDGTFRGAAGGRFHVDAGGVVTEGTPACPG